MNTQSPLQDILAENNPNALRDHIETLHPADLSEIFEDVPPADIWRAVSLLPRDRQAVIFSYLPLETQIDLAHEIPRNDLAAVLTEMSADDRADLFHELTPQEQLNLIPALSHAEREDIRRLAAYPDGTTGAIMTSDYAVLPPDLTVQQALDKLRLEAPDKETIYRSYIVDDQRRLLGSVRLKDLIIGQPDAKIKDLMDIKSPFLLATDPQEETARKMAKYDMLALPVVDDTGRLIGIVTHDDAMDVVAEEATEDFHKMVHVGKLSTSIRDATIAILYRHRVTWLLLLVFVNIFTGAGIAYFEDVIATYLVLVFFLPLLIDSAGNAGAQSSTLMIRALATGDVRPTDWRRLVSREFLVALAIGTTMALAVSMIGMYRGGYEIALVVGLSMCAVAVVGCLVGMSLPFLLSRVNLDPATASAPLVTSIADIAGVLIYFSIASALLEMPILE